MKKSMGLNLLGIFLAALTVTILFQNCGRPVHEKEIESMGLEDFFQYSYEERPNFYLAQRLLKPVEAVENLAQFKYFAAVSYVDSDAETVSYEVSILSLTGATLCPHRSGTLAPGISTIEFDCVSAVISAQAIVTLKVSAVGATQSITNVYR